MCKMSWGYIIKLMSYLISTDRMKLLLERKQRGGAAKAPARKINVLDSLKT